MSARRRRRRKGSGSGDGGSNGSGGGKNRSGGKNRRKRGGGSGGAGSSRSDGAGFWGDKKKIPTLDADVKITDDPAAVPRSLGTPPLPGHEQIAGHFFTAVYQRAVTTAGALAAAGGMIAPEKLTDELEDDDEE